MQEHLRQATFVVRPDVRPVPDPVVAVGSLPPQCPAMPDLRPELLGWVAAVGRVAKRGSPTSCEGRRAAGKGSPARLRHRSVRVGARLAPCVATGEACIGKRRRERKGCEYEEDE